MRSALIREPLLELENVTVVREGHVALKSISFSIEQGESVVVLGPNGSGKSTLVKLINRELYPYADEGTIKILGKARWHVVELRQHLGIVSNDLAANMDASLTGLDVVLSGYTGHLSLHWRDHIQADWLPESREALARAGASEFENRPFGKLSSGEARRVLVARALAHNPSALLLDEPTTSLDIKSRFEFLELVGALQRTGVSVVLVTHHVEEILPFFTRVICLNSGEVKFDGSRQKIMTSHTVSSTFDIPLALTGDGPYQASILEPEVAVK